MTDFTSLGLAEPLLRAVAAEGYTQPTPIQAAAIPTVIAGRDVLGIAQTGTGKTAAFLLPLLDRLAALGQRPQRRQATTLILAPTRELANQIADGVRTYGRFLKPVVATIIGGAAYGPQIAALARGADVVVATPGRLNDHLQTGALSLDGTRFVVLDEADQMLDLGFLPAVRRILARTPADRQTLLFSATMPGQIRSLADDFLKDPAEIAVAAQSRPIERIAQSVELLPAGEKRDALVRVLAELGQGRSIVFTRTKRGADKVSQHLNDAGLAAVAIHGDKSQGQRERALGTFKTGRTPVLVATDIAARGIDIDDVQLVVNFELPNVPEAYVHRIGRTARAGASGRAIAFCAPDERPLLRDIEKLIGERIPGSPEPGPQDRGQARPQPQRGRPGGGQRRNGPPAGHHARPAQGQPRRAAPQPAAAAPAARPAASSASTDGVGLARMLDGARPRRRH